MGSWRHQAMIAYYIYQQSGNGRHAQHHRCQKDAVQDELGRLDSLACCLRCARFWIFGVLLGGNTLLHQFTGQAVAFGANRCASNRGLDL